MRAIIGADDGARQAGAALDSVGGVGKQRTAAEQAQVLVRDTFRTASRGNHPEDVCHQTGGVGRLSRCNRFCTRSGAARQDVGDSRARPAVAVEMVGRIAAVRDLPLDGLDDLRAGRGRRRRRSRPRSRPHCRVPMLTVGTPINAPSRNGALELPTAHAQLFISRT